MIGKLGRNNHFFAAKLILLSAILFFGILGTQIAHAATLYFSPSSGNFSVGNIFSVNILVDTTGTAINNSDAVINFPTSLLDVISVSKSGSIFSLWVEEPSFSNASGVISFVGGLPTPGFNGKSGKIVSVAFRAKKAGTANVFFSDAAVRANDGFGTNVLQARSDAQFNLIVEEGVVPPAVVGLPDAPNISSPTHPDQNSWYAESTATFKWPVGQGINATRLKIDRDPTSAPTVLYIPAIGERTIDDLEDGIWYFHARLRNEAGWSRASHFRAQIDTESPESFEITLAPRPDESDPKVSFIFDAFDKTSGISHYEVRVDGGSTARWEDDGTHIYITENLKDGDHVLVAKVYDKAGNFLTQSINFTIAERAPLLRIGFVVISFLSVIVPIIALILLLILLLMYIRHRHLVLKKRLRKEVSEAERAIHKAFDKIKEDIHDQIKMLEKAKSHRELTQEEGKIIQRLRKDINEAEKHVSKEMKDIDKEIS